MRSVVAFRHVGAGGVVHVTVVPAHTPLAQLSPVVHASPSSHAAPLAWAYEHDPFEHVPVC